MWWGPAGARTAVGRGGARPSATPGLARWGTWIRGTRRGHRRETTAQTLQRADPLGPRPPHQMALYIPGAGWGPAAATRKKKNSTNDLRSARLRLPKAEAKLKGLQDLPTWGKRRPTAGGQALGAAGTGRGGTSMGSGPGRSLRDTENRHHRRLRRRQGVNHPQKRHPARGPPPWQARIRPHSSRFAAMAG